MLGVVALQQLGIAWSPAITVLRFIDPSHLPRLIFIVQSIGGGNKKRVIREPPAPHVRRGKESQGILPRKKKKYLLYLVHCTTRQIIFQESSHLEDTHSCVYKVTFVCPSAVKWMVLEMSMHRGWGRGSLQLQVLRTRRVHFVRTGHYGERAVVKELSPLVQGRGGRSSTAAWRGADVSTVHGQHGGNGKEKKNIYISGEEKDRGGPDCEAEREGSWTMKWRN